MVDLNRQIRATQARQGGFSAHVLPSPVSYAPVAADWGMGWLFTNDPPVNGVHDVNTVTGISGDGSVSASFTVDTGGKGNDFGQPNRVTVLPVHQDTFVVLFEWRMKIELASFEVGSSASINLGNVDDLLNSENKVPSSQGTTSGTGKKGLLLSRNTASVINVPIALDNFNPAEFSQPYDYNQGQSLLDDALGDAYTGGEGWEFTNSFPSSGQTVKVGTGFFYGSSPPDGNGKWRISLASDSGFARAIDEVSTVAAAQEGSVWFKNYNQWNGLQYRLERETALSSNQWEPWSDSISLTGAPVSITPLWTALIVSDGFDGERLAPSTFYPLVSIPFGDHRQYLSDEFGLVIP
jgi:hypothetical protein